MPTNEKIKFPIGDEGEPDTKADDINVEDSTNKPSIDTPKPEDVGDTNDPKEKKEKDDIEVKDDKEDKSDTSTPAETKDDVAEVDVDGVIYKLDDKGNALDDSGNIKYTKEEIEAFSEASSSEEEEDINYIQEVAKRINVELLDENGKPIEYENSIEGLAKYTSDVREQARVETASSVIGDLFSNYPGLEEAYYYAKSNNGSLEGFTPQPDYSNITIGDDVEQHKALIYAERVAKGDSPEVAQRFVKYSVEEKLNKDDATSALNYLKETRNKQLAERKAIEQKEEEAAIEDSRKYRNAILDTIKSKKLVVGGEEIILPDVLRIKDGSTVKQKTHKDFVDYIFTPKKYKVNDSEVELTQNQYDLYMEQQNRDHNTDLYEALRRFLKYDEGQLIKGAVAANKAREIKKLVSSKAKAKQTAKFTSKDRGIKLPI
jgi:hypothetical protein